MPAGFQQDLNQLNPNFYRIAIDMSGYPTTGLQGGGVTANSTSSFAEGKLPTTLAYSQNRARGNMRFENIVRRLTSLGDCKILDITITEANANVQATAIAFTVMYERDGFIPSSGIAVDGATPITSKALKIKDEVVRGILDKTSASVRVYTPEDSSDGQQYLEVDSPVSVANAIADVTVTLNTDTTLVN